jgi:(2Fe-2S) ferredoxin
MKRKSLFLCSTLCLLSCAVSPTLRAQNSGFVYVTNKPTSAQLSRQHLGLLH